MSQLQRKIVVPEGSNSSVQEYQKFLETSYSLLKRHCLYFAEGHEDINHLELAHLVPPVAESVIAIYLGVNDAVCNKGLVCPILVRHGHNNVFVFDPQIYTGGENIPDGTIDAKKIINGFEPPNATWDIDWTYVMISDPARTFQQLWQETGYIDMIPAKFEDFTMFTETRMSKLCIFIDPAAFEHPVNKTRGYLNAARDLGQKMAGEFYFPDALDGETDGLVPVILNKGEKLYLARTDFGPCDHAWSNIHPDNQEYAVVNENSAVPLDLVIAKPPANSAFAADVVPPKGSADMTTDWFYRSALLKREPLLEGTFKG
jgi:hypothetical protein